MKKTTALKLSLSTETVRCLDTSTLQIAVGGRMRLGSATVNQDLKCFPTEPTAGCATDGCSAITACE